MSKEKVQVGFSVHGYTASKFGYLEGRIRTIIEAVGLPERQSKSITDLIIGETWGMFNKPQYSYDYEGIEDDFNAKMIE